MLLAAAGKVTVQAQEVVRVAVQVVTRQPEVGLGQRVVVLWRAGFVAVPIAVFVASSRPMRLGSRQQVEAEPGSMPAKKVMVTVVV